jgi:AcrR family transcriptional regulator
MASVQKETKRERITKAAVRLFNNTHNFNKVSLEDIAREANVSPTTIYNNFGNRDNLIVSVIKHIHLAGLETYKTIIRADIPFPEKIKLSMERKINVVGELDWNLIDKMVAQDTGLANFAAEINEVEAKPMLLELIEDGKQQGHIDPYLLNEAIMMYLEILQESGSAFFRIISAPGVSPDVLKDLNHILLYGFMNREKENEQS